MRLIDADKYCDFLNTYPLEKAQNNFMSFYRDVLQKTFEFEVKAIPVEWTKQMKNRLVDKAEVLETLGELYEIFDDSREIQKEIDKIYDKINDLPYVDVECKVEPYREAIPIEWIKRYIAEEGIYPNRELLSVEQADAIEKMVENWEKENEPNKKNTSQID